MAKIMKSHLQIAPVLAMIILAAPATAAIRYVNRALPDPVGSGDGQSWETAYRELKHALTAPPALQPGDEIWVAAGTYRPDFNGNSYTNNRSQSFDLPANGTSLNPIRILGGFSGCETDESQRDPVNNATVLSGFLGISGGMQLRSCHVVRGLGNDTDVILDGFTVTGGESIGSELLCGTQYFALDGAGILLKNGGAIIRNCIVENNTALHSAGNSFGGGIAIESTTPNAFRTDIINTVVRSNYSAYAGGGLQTNTQGDVNIYNCSFIENTAATEGGGAHFAGGGLVRIVNTLMAHNIFELQGGHGAAIEAHHDAGPLEFVNSTIAHNGLINIGTGGGIYIHQSGNPITINNSIFWGNLAFNGYQIAEESPSVSTTATRSNIQRSVSTDTLGSITYVECIGTLADDNPRFINPNPPAFDFRLSSTQFSRCIDRGSNIIMPLDIVDLDGDGFTPNEKVPFDLAGIPRRFDHPSVLNTGVIDSSEQPPVNSMVDIGAYEAPDCVDAMASGCNDFVWCTEDSCGSGICGNECIPRLYGDVFLDQFNVVNLEDILTILNAFSSDFSSCVGGTLSGCDLRDYDGCPSLCGSDGIINLGDILAVLEAFSNPTICPSCCEGGAGLMGGGESGGVGNLGVAEEIITFLGSKEASESLSEELQGVLAEAFAIFVKSDFSEEEKATVAEMLQNAQANTEDSQALGLLAQIAEEISE